MANQELVPATNYTLSPAEYALLEGDLSRLSEGDRLNLYNAVCTSLGLNPMTAPFGYIRLSGKLTLYAKKDCTDQLRKIHGVSITDLTGRDFGGAYVVTAKAQDKSGRVDVGTGAVTLDGLKGEALCNALMKAESKAKRRVTLSICGLGMLDESEVGSIPGAETATGAQETTQAHQTDDPLSLRRRRALLTFKEHFDKSALTKCLEPGSIRTLDNGVIHLGKTFGEMSDTDLDAVEAFMADPNSPTRKPEPTDADLVEAARAHVEANAE